MAIQFGFEWKYYFDISEYETKRTSSKNVTVHQNQKRFLFFLTRLITQKGR
jgi:hypothetical protein